VVGIIFESRPDVVPQIAALTLRSGNAVIFKGGAEAAHTNEVLCSIWHEALRQFQDLPIEAISLLRSRAEVTEMLALDDEIDLIIPRGSQQFVRHIADESRIPVLGHGEGICHVYVDQAADVAKAVAIAFDSKVDYPAACNAMETLLVHEEIAGSFLPIIVSCFRDAGVEIRACSRSLALPGCQDLTAASDQDWSSEYSDLIVSIKIVDSAAAAMEHIQTYGSRHTESIVTEDQDLARQFMESVDAAGVYHNASTRFADGYRYGLGAELGISTNKLHARGPVGLEGLTTYKYQLFGQGHIVATYGRGETSFKHRPIEKELKF
jgi:glutamate-5-semialdehyde dehydrogenase